MTTPALMAELCSAHIQFNGVHLAIAIAIAVVAFCAGYVYAWFAAEDEYDEEIRKLIGEIEELKARAEK